jgi:hypothetical protein
MVDLIDTQDFANQILIANTKMRLSPSIYNTRTFVNFLMFLEEFGEKKFFRCVARIFLIQKYVTIQKSLEDTGLQYRQI